MIYFDNVSKKYPDGTHSLESVMLSITPGEFISIVGHSGAGKTTIAKLILAEEKPSEGSVFFESKDIHSLSDRELREFRRRIGIVFQDFRLLANKTAYENIAFAMESAGKSDEEIEDNVPRVLELVDMGHRISHFPHQLSGGEKQRLAIARAIITEPKVIIADEPTGNLDPINANDVMNILKKINDLGTTVILTTHNRDVVNTVGGRVITLEKGRIIRDDKDGKYVI